MKRLNFGRRLAYGLGDTANNLLFQLTLLYLLYFFTDVLGLPPALAGIIFVTARVWDAISNPIMGYIMDHTRSKRGNARVYLRFGPLPLAALTALLFYAPPLGEAGKFAYGLLVYALWSFLYTMVNIPYASMTAQLTDDPEERTSLTSVRMICMLLGVIVVSVATEPLASAFGSGGNGYFAVAAIYGLLALALFEVCLRGTSGLPLVAAKDQASYRVRDVFRVLGANKPALVVSLTFFLGASAEYIRESSVVYYVSYNMGDPGLIPAFLGIVVVSMIVGNLLIPVVAAKLDKRGTYIAGVILSSAASLVFQFLPYGDTAAILAVAAASSLGFSVVSTMGWAMLPDTVEYGEAKTGVRSEGIIYAFFSFSQKLATAVGGGVVSFALASSGYAPRSGSQTPEALRGIASTLGILPLAFLLLSVGAALFYKLDKSSFLALKAGGAVEATE